MAVSIQDVRDLSATGWDQTATDDQVQNYIDDATTEADTIYSKRMSNLPNLDGDRDMFIKNLAAHKLELHEGGEAQSESNAGGNLSFNLQAGSQDVMQYLSMTRYGRTAAQHIREEESIGIAVDWVR